MRKADQLASQVLSWSRCHEGAVKGRGNCDQGGEGGNRCHEGGAVDSSGKV